MDAKSFDDGNLPLAAFVFEAALVPAAFLAGWLTGVDPLATLADPNGAPLDHLVNVLWGILASIPLFAGLALIVLFPVGPLARLNELAFETIWPLFRSVRVWQLGLAAVMAGIGEEMLFRGWLQVWAGGMLADPYGTLIGLVLASLVFGACHWLSHAYMIAVVIVGLYLGILLVLTDSILVPITAHAVYDFGALIYLRFARPR